MPGEPGVPKMTSLLPTLFLLLLPLPSRRSWHLALAQHFSAPNTTFNHLAMDAATGMLYVGAVNHLYQLTPDLQQVGEAVTGPIWDSPDCLPFRDRTECPQARPTDNANQLLLVSGQARELVACGQVRQGVCEKRSLGNVAQLVFRAEDPGDGQFVAANAPGVATVGLVVSAPGRDLLYVARGLAGKLSAGVPPLTVRQLAGPQAFSSEGLGRLVVGDFSDYNNSYVGAFAGTQFAYFLFRRRGSRTQADYRSYVARVCLNDANLYSYVEMPLVCQGYSLVQAAYLAPGQGGGTLLVVASPGPMGGSALCAFPLQEVDSRMERARRLCYTMGGHSPAGEEATIEYGVTSRCVFLPSDSPDSYPCGDEHTPSPIASHQPLEAEPLLTSIPHLSAVAALEEAGHTIVFLGDTQGQLHKVFLNGSTGQLYSSLPVGPPGTAVNPDLLLDRNGSHLYVMTSSQVTKVPISSCQNFPDCPSCLQAQDPFCGWCVLQGRCVRKEQCAGSEQSHQWLWSYGAPEGSLCLAIQSLVPSQQPRQEQGQVTMVVPRLPVLAPDKYFHCAFDDYETLAQVDDSQVVCESPPQEQLPPSGEGTDHITVPLALMFEDISVAVTNFSFYDCQATGALDVAAPCSACVRSPWRCHWCPQSASCVSGDSCPDGERTVYHSQEADVLTKGPDFCPHVEGLATSHLVPVGWETRLALRVRNLHHYQSKAASYHCWLELPGALLGLQASLEEGDGDTQLIRCQAQQFRPSPPRKELQVPIYVTRGNTHRVDNAGNINVTLYDCTVGHEDCSHCQAADKNLSCVWCSQGRPTCSYRPLCPPETVESLCPLPSIHLIKPQTGPPEGGVALTILGSNLGSRLEDVADAVTVAGQPCRLDPTLYHISTQIVCVTSPALKDTTGPIKVTIKNRPPSVSAQLFSYQDPVLRNLSPRQGPRAGGTLLTIFGHHLLTESNVRAFLGDEPCHILGPVCPEAIVCRTGPWATPGEAELLVVFGLAQRRLATGHFSYTPDPQLLSAEPSVGFRGGGRMIRVTGTNLDVVQRPLLSVWLEEAPAGPQQLDPQQVAEHRCADGGHPQAAQDTKAWQTCSWLETGLLECSTGCSANSSGLLLCPSPALPGLARLRRMFFTLDNIRVDFVNASGGQDFLYQPDPHLHPLSRDRPAHPYRLKPGNVLDVEGEGLNLGISKDEVQVQIGKGECVVKTLTLTHLYCEPPMWPPPPLNSSSALPEFIVHMGNLRLNLGPVKYEVEASLPSFPTEAQIGLGVGVSVLISMVLLLILMYRRKSKQAMRDYKKVLVQLENLEISVGDQCRKEFTDLMTEMTDLSSDLEGSGIPFLDYKTFTERVFFPGHHGSPLRSELDVPDARRATVKQGLNQLANLLNSKLFLIKFIHTLEEQPTFSQRDRCYVASLLSLALHGKLEYLTDIMKTLLNDLTAQYVQKNPKLMLRRTETMVEKLLTNWMSICLYSFLKEVAGEPLYMLFRAIKYQVDKGPVDAVTGKAKRTLNDSRLLREDVEFWPLTLTVLVGPGTGTGELQRVPARVLNTDTITQVKEKVLDQVYKGTPFSQRPSVHALDLEWRSGLAGHLTLSDEDLTSVTQNQWKRLNTLQHYKVPDGATVGLIPRMHNGNGISKSPNQSFLSGESLPMLEDGDESGIRLWHLVKCTEEPEVPKQRRSSLRERERAKAIPEIYLTRLLSMKGTLQKFVDDTFQAILSVDRPVPIAVKYLFDFLDELADKYGIEDQETLHIWKTNSLLLRFWVNTLKNPQFIFDVRVSDNVDAILTVIAQTFIDSCTISEHKVGRDSPVNKLLYAREIPRYKQMVEKYYADIRQNTTASYQEMNSALTELSGNYASDITCLVALHELYNYINKYYDQIISALEEDPVGQKMQLAYRLQQIAALVENKVTDL
ncbi:plexin-B3 isoform X1 [Monodelphis domestica]|uniref:plexin-B3 isoform X1 n=2 Tax=Monodelphis domestica TaxID=13616 RepID=UPI0024E24B35|nr:plexin-B3 isoform X1 [Monodelphis domestica]